MAWRQVYLPQGGPPLPDGWITRAEACRQLGLHWAVVQRLIGEGQLVTAHDMDRGLLILEMSLRTYEATSGHFGPERIARCEPDPVGVDIAMRAGEPAPAAWGITRRTPQNTQEMSDALLQSFAARAKGG